MNLRMNMSSTAMLHLSMGRSWTKKLPAWIVFHDLVTPTYCGSCDISYVNFFLRNAFLTGKCRPALSSFRGADAWNCAVGGSPRAAGAAFKNPAGAAFKSLAGAAFKNTAGAAFKNTAGAALKQPDASTKTSSTQH